MHCFPDANTAGAMEILAPQQFAHLSGGLVKGGCETAAGIDAQAGEGIRYSGAPEVFGLNQEGCGMDDDRVGEKGPRTRLECSGSELGKGMVAAIRQDHVVAGLRATIESHDGVGVPHTAEVISVEPLPAVPES